MQDLQPLIFVVVQVHAKMYDLLRCCGVVQRYGKMYDLLLLHFLVVWEHGKMHVLLLLGFVVLQEHGQMDDLLTLVSVVVQEHGKMHDLLFLGFMVACIGVQKDARFVAFGFCVVQGHGKMYDLRHLVLAIVQGHIGFPCNLQATCTVRKLPHAF